MLEPFFVRTLAVFAFISHVLGLYGSVVALLLLLRAAIETLPIWTTFDVIWHLAEFFIDNKASYGNDIFDLVSVLHADRQFLLVIAAYIASGTLWRVDRLLIVVLVHSLGGMDVIS
jgi:hypothetical protein